MLFLNVSAGIGMIGMASPTLQEVFAGSLIGHPDISFTHLNNEQRRMVATIGTLVLTVFGHLDFSLRVGTTGSRVPYKSLFRLHAAYMQDVARAVFRTAPQLIPGTRRPPVLTSSLAFRHFRIELELHLRDLQSGSRGAHIGVRGECPAGDPEERAENTRPDRRIARQQHKQNEAHIS